MSPRTSRRSSRSCPNCESEYRRTRSICSLNCWRVWLELVRMRAARATETVSVEPNTERMISDIAPSPFSTVWSLSVWPRCRSRGLQDAGHFRRCGETLRYQRSFQPLPEGGQWGIRLDKRRNRGERRWDSLAVRGWTPNRSFAAPAARPHRAGAGPPGRAGGIPGPGSTRRLGTLNPQRGRDGPDTRQEATVRSGGKAAQAEGVRFGDERNGCARKEKALPGGGEGLEQGGVETDSGTRRSSCRPRRPPVRATTLPWLPRTFPLPAPAPARGSSPGRRPRSRSPRSSRPW